MPDNNPTPSAPEIEHDEGTIDMPGPVIRAGNAPEVTDEQMSSLRDSLMYLQRGYSCSPDADALAALLAAWDAREREMKSLRSEVEALRRLDAAVRRAEPIEGCLWWDTSLLPALAAIDAARKDGGGCTP